ncbi:LPXTG-site transpeptidase (sortase) family protein [Actinoplanes lutulentus]|uniref:LPXTG-site transpeptidase (Sortase) family protein n=1 Tax=Actinoplanes lutulentus TaxID=1287878 RepID=A0A327ZDA1_9ACTN|nr:class E sortase [Actinoplanes lutulentus]MBB2942541.1 LPXTG-site transpeptidase (sortase) family protein [Actinoplanes lutulentus]RAK38122.1 LPXTG-site transpeptidase (sortase) family protein [Actinoplanes lutulentus]
MRRAATLTAALALLALLAIPGSASAAGPAITVDQKTTLIGDTITVSLTGWPAGVVTASLCGNEARDGSADCAVQSASSTSVPATGKAGLRLRVSAPPVGCPCVVRASTITGEKIADTPIDVTDVADAATVTATTGDAELTVLDAGVRNRWTLWSLLGGTAYRTMTVTVRNEGTAASPGSELSLDLGRAAGSEAMKALPIGPLAPGAELRLEIPFAVAAPAAGRYQLTGRIDGTAGTEATFTTSTAVWPWLLLLVPLGLILIVRAAASLKRMSPLRAGGAGLIAAGGLCAVVLAAQTLLPGPETAGAQAALDSQLAAAWAGAPATEAKNHDTTTVTSLDQPAPVQGQPFAVLHVPRWHAEYTIVEGVSTADLRKGPGHYPGSALPGQIGNMAVAGHRGPAGLPFNDIDTLRAGDPIMVETATSMYVYRVQRHVIVPPTRVDVVAPTPEKPGVEPTVAMLTLTACHPRFSSKQRYILFAVLDEVTAKSQ